MGRQTKKKQPNNNRKARISKKNKRKPFFKLQVGGSVLSSENIDNITLLHDNAQHQLKDAAARPKKTLMGKFSQPNNTNLLEDTYYSIKETYENLQDGYNETVSNRTQSTSVKYGIDGNDENHLITFPQSLKLGKKGKMLYIEIKRILMEHNPTASDSLIMSHIIKHRKNAGEKLILGMQNLLEQLRNKYLKKQSSANSSVQAESSLDEGESLSRQF